MRLGKCPVYVGALNSEVCPYRVAPLLSTVCFVRLMLHSIDFKYPAGVVRRKTAGTRIHLFK